MNIQVFLFSWIDSSHYQNNFLYLFNIKYTNAILDTIVIAYVSYLQG